METKVNQHGKLIYILPCTTPGCEGTREYSIIPNNIKKKNTQCFRCVQKIKAIKANARYERRVYKVSCTTLGCTNSREYSIKPSTEHIATAKCFSCKNALMIKYSRLDRQIKRHK